MHSITQAFRAGPDDRTAFRVGRFNTGEQYACITVGDVDLYLELPQLVALRAALEETLIDMNTQAASLTEDEDGHSLRADQHDRENAA